MKSILKIGDKIWRNSDNKCFIITGSISDSFFKIETFDNGGEMTVASIERIKDLFTTKHQRRKNIIDEL